MSRSPRTGSSRSALPRRLARFNRVVTNRVQGLWAPYLVPWAVIVHVGRNTGARYSTPVLAFRRGNRVAVGLPYGEKTQWVLNLLASDGGLLRRAGREFRFEQPEIVGSRGRQIPLGARFLGRLTDRVLIARVSPIAASEGK